MTAPTPRPGIMDIKPYVGGESTLANQARVHKLSSNEGALGPSPLAIVAYENAARIIQRYPDGGHGPLRHAIGNFHGVDPARIICGAGSDEIITNLCRAYVGPGDEVLYSRHGFLMYPIAAMACGATPVMAPEINLTASVDNLLAAVTPRTRIVFIANPNNPTGTYLPHAEVLRLRQALPDNVLLVLDEAYFEFVTADDYQSGLKLVDECPDNVVVTRTFSKIYGLGGMRLGWCYGPTPVVDVINRFRDQFSVSVPTQAAGLAAVEDVHFLDQCRHHNSHWRAFMDEKLTELGLEHTPSQGNFHLVHFPHQPRRDAAAADAFLRQHGIIVRATRSYGLEDWLRMTVGNGEECTLLMQVLADFVKGK